ncbi:sigma-70 family RNA polymerase sigma factor [Nocardia sp. NPDC004654]|uniref:RNA polymerase sigma factor n=1 Tax=Nocardia sp. NPDC004654 TaxID=3154776 RepID=UPI0033AE87AE
MTDPILPELVEAQQRFEELFRRHSPAVFRYAYRLLNCDTHRANEIVQEVFIAVWIQFNRDFRDKSMQSSLPMIMKIATRRVLDDVRKRSNSVVLVPDFVDDHVLLLTPTGRRNPLDLVLSSFDREHFRHVLMEELTDAEYHVALMSWELGLPDAEVGEYMGITTSTVRSHKCRARKKIHEIVERGDHRIGNPREFEREGADLGKSSGGEATA